MTSATTEAVGTPSQYTFSNTFDAGAQLQLLAAILDQHTEAVLTETGIEPGWKCLDVGAGAGTITAWMADQVGPDGHVTALDTDPQHIRGGGNVAVRQGDVRTLELPEAHYDLIHARLVLLHIAEREAVLRRLVAALAPGGVLVLSEWDGQRRDWMLHAPTPEGAEAFDAFQDALLAELTAHGADLGWARRVPSAMETAGLSDVRAGVHSQLWAGGEPGCLLHLSNAQQLQDALAARGLTAQQLAVLEATMRDPATRAYCYWTFTTTGRRAEN
ncbi:class I SAM-dependent methyltransferase [Actinoplanes sichuanensis]|uniref:Methyltransferase domain-containing protein n=1 Tax=Actinoplanes sichuanensis TaxID=512349 RepID=A0ABW4A266_9ACTN|nr:class I SAM-dependent methyltransferase [Actinoplanes sichuanensis]BEL12927.1 class I SAM-dependent methyltransferase [Actinoplanes sichuanensis]